MEQKIFESIINDTAEVFKEAGFSEQDGTFANDKYAVKVEYDEAKKLCQLMSKATGENDFITINSWLLDDSTSANDAKSIVLDFTESFNKLIGVKKTVAAAEIKLPTKADLGETPNVTALCSKVLAVYPQFKDTYKEHVTQYGSFLPITFFKATIVPEFRKQLENGIDKQVQKTLSFLGSMYEQGDREVGNLVGGVILMGAIGDSKERYERADSLIESTYLKVALKNLFARYPRDKKLKSILE